jgi:hypothetical protein
VRYAIELLVVRNIQVLDFCEKLVHRRGKFSATLFKGGGDRDMILMWLVQDQLWHQIR